MRNTVGGLDTRPAHHLGAHAEGGDKGAAATPTLRLELRGCGRFLLYASCRPATVLLDGQPAEGVEWEEQSGAAWFDVPWRGDQESGAASRLAVVRF